MTKRHLVYIGENSHYIQSVRERIDCLNRELFNQDNEYQFNSLSFNQLKGFICQIRSQGHEISAVILDKEFSLSEMPGKTVYGRDEEEVTIKDFENSFKGLERLLPNVPVLSYPSCVKKIRRLPTELEKELLKDRLFQGTSLDKYSAWIASEYKNKRVWTSNPLKALVDAQKAAQTDSSPMIVLVYNNAPLTLFKKSKIGNEFGIGYFEDFTPDKKAFENLEVEIALFSETRKARKKGSLADLLKTYSTSDFNRTYFREALRNVRETRRESRTKRESQRLMVQKYTQFKRLMDGKQPSLTPAEITVGLKQAQISEIPHSSQRYKIDTNSE